MKLWVDDLRDEPDGWTRAYTSQEAIDILETQEVEILSLDHDLGENDQGVTIVNWLEWQDRAEGIDLWPQYVYIHSSNPVGRQNMERVINASGKYGRKTSGITEGMWSGIDGWMRNQDLNKFVTSSIAAYRRYKDVYFI